MSFNENNVYNVKTVIIGSGISGIAASINFLKRGYDDFIIVEAENRIGYLFQ